MKTRPIEDCGICDRSYCGILMVPAPYVRGVIVS